MTLESGSSLLVDTSLLKSKSEVSLLHKESLEVKFSEMKSFLCSSVTSCQSIWTEGSSITKGQLQCFQKGGMSSFIFSVDDASQEIYMASPQKIESTAEKAIDTMYSFYFKENKKSNSRSHRSILTNLIAKMKVSSFIVLKPNCVKVMETEFVLYVSEKLSNELHKSSSAENFRMKGFPKNITKMLRPSNMKKIKSKNKVNRQEVDLVSHANVSSIVNGATDSFLPNLELAAIVVEECLQDTTLMFNGWGLKFLEKVSQKDTSSEPPFPPCCSENPGGSAKSMDVIVPAGLHGGPVAQNGGITRLIDRWRSGGCCDCGGWDLGCPLRILNYTSLCSSNVFPEDNEKKSINLFMEGKMNGRHPTLSVTKMTEGSYSIYFRPPLSVLQSFSIAVAAIHTKIAEKK